MPFLQKAKRQAAGPGHLAVPLVPEHFCRQSICSLRKVGGAATMYYVCFDCGKHVEDEYTKTKVRCPYCGGKVLYKDRRTVTKVKAR